MPWVALSEMAKILSISPEKAGWMLRKLRLKRRRVKGHSQWFIEPELLPNELRQKLLPILETATHKLLPSRLQNTAIHESRGSRNTTIQTATYEDYYPRTATSNELLRVVYDYLKRNHPVIERERLKDVLQDILKRLLDEFTPKGYKPVEIEKVLVQVIKSYRDLGFMNLLGIGDEP